MTPLVSILIPCHNASEWLGETLESALGQTWQNREIIVVDDGSTDDSAEIVRSYASRGVTLISQPNRGQSAAFNTAIRAARGDYYEFLDADDLLAPDKIEIQLRALAQHPPGTLCAGAWARFTIEREEANFQPEAIWIDHAPVDWLIASWEGDGMMHGAAWLVPAALVRQAGGWTESLTLINDFDFFTRVVLASTHVVFQSDARSYYRSGNVASLSNAKSHAALQSAYDSLVLGTSVLLEKENSPRTRHAAAVSFQRFVHSYYPQHLSIIRAAERRVRELGGCTLIADGGQAFRRMSAIVGWKAARFVQIAFQRAFPPRYNVPKRRPKNPPAVHAEVSVAPIGNSAQAPSPTLPAALVSIIIPCHNASTWLRATLDSALGQTWPACEIIVVDDGSTDDSAAIVDSYAARGVILLRQEKRGAASARNAGLRAARGEYIQFLDADDLISPEKIARQIAMLAANSPTAIAAGPWGTFTSHVAEAVFRPQPAWSSREPADWLICSWSGGGMFPPVVWLTRRSVIDTAGWWNEELSLDDDGEYFCRVLLSSNRVCFVPDAPSYYRSHAGPRLSSIRGRRAAQSSYTSLQLKEHHLLSVDNSNRARRAVGIHWQRFAWEQLAATPDLASAALARAKALAPDVPAPDGPRAYKLAASVLGWHRARRLQLAAHRFFRQ